jgi:DNA polymerase I-like protein with 3'-5' exonuclease and polymerase domains
MIISKQDFPKILAHLKSNGTLAFDTETTGLRPFSGDVVFSIIIAESVDTAYYFNFNPLEPSCLLGEQELSGLRDLFADPTRLWYAHNAIYDCLILKESMNIDVCGEVFCTFAQGRVAYNEHFQYGLDASLKRIGLSKNDEVSAYVSTHKLKTKIAIPDKKDPYEILHYEKVPLDIIARYALDDAKGTFALGMELYTAIAIKSIDKINDQPAPLDVMKNEMKLHHALVRSTRRGLLLDKPYINRAIEFERERLHSSIREFEQSSGLKYVNHFKTFEKVFADERSKFTFGEKTKTGQVNPIFDEDSLRRLENPLAKEVLKARDSQGKLNFYNSFLFYSDKNNVLHPNMISGGTNTGRFSSKEPNCLSEDTELLTESGWKNMSTYSGEKVFAYNPGDHSLHLESPTRVIKNEVKTRRMISAKNEHFDILTTEDHRTFFRNRRTQEGYIVNAKEFRKDAHVIHAGVSEEGYFLGLSDEEIKLLCAVQADGCFRRKSTVFTFSKERKITRLRGILLSTGVKFTENTYPTRGVTTFTASVGFEYFKGLLSPHKTFSSLLLELPPHQKDLLLSEIRLWDGSSTREPLRYYSKIKQNVDIVQALCSLRGLRSKISKYTNRSGGSCYVLYSTNRPYSGTANAKITSTTVESRVWCVTVSTGVILARRNNLPFITGNCQNFTSEDLMTCKGCGKGYETITITCDRCSSVEFDRPEFLVRRAFIPRPDYVFFNPDYSSQEYRMMLDMAKKLYDAYRMRTGLPPVDISYYELLRKIKEENYDIHQATAEMVGVSRTEAKTVNFALLYGAGVSKMANQLGISDEESSDLRYKYFKALPYVQFFIKTATRTAEARGFVKNWLGRHNYMQRDWAYKAPNQLIQGGCADVMKVLMVRLDEMLKHTKSHQLLSIHDEVIVETHYSDVDKLPQKIIELMESIYPHNYLPLTASAEWSDISLADKKKGLPQWTHQKQRA